MNVLPPLPYSVRRLYVEVMPGSGLLLLSYENVSADSPSGAGGYGGFCLNLHDLGIRKTANTFFLKFQGGSMKGAGIFDGDILIVDRSLKAVAGNVVVVTVAGEYAVKRLDRQGAQVFLLPEDPDCQPIMVEDLDDLVFWGVVTVVIRSLSGRSSCPLPEHA